MANKKQKKSGIFGMIFSFLIGGVIGGFLGACMVTHMPDGLSVGQGLMRMGGMLLLLYASIFLQIVIHEGGHLAFGLASGYEFVFFRIGSFQWTRTEGKLRFGRHSLAGTAGQCLLSPPDMVDGKFPVMLYNLGGSLMNLFSTVVFLILYIMAGDKGLFSFFCLSMGVMGAMGALTNGIPMRLGTVDNDGYNAISVGKNKDAMRSLWLQLKINAELAGGKRLKEMPDAWFTVPGDEAMTNSMAAVIGVFASNRLMDQNRYPEADALMAHFLSIESGMVGLHRNMLICDRMCCEMIGENRREVIDGMYTKELRRFMKSMKNSPSVIRTQYLYARLVEHDPKKEATLLEQFRKISKTYPYPNDLQSDREMIMAAQGRAESEERSHG